MPFLLSTEDIDGRLHVKAQGDAGLPEFIGLADLVAAIARGRAARRVLIDLLDLQQRMAFTEHLQLGAHLGRLAMDIERIATVVPAAQRSGASEKAAQKAGVGLRTFTDVASAIAWLDH